MSLLRSPLLSMLLLLAGCGSVTTLDGERLRLTSPAFRAYVESVFRAQNRAATELAFALESKEIGTDGFARLESAETGLIRACAGLNEVAAGRRDERRLGRLREAGAARQAPDCERATLAADAALASVRQ